MRNYRDCLILLAVAILTVAGAIAAGLGSLTQAHNNSRGEFTEQLGNGILAIGAFCFLLVFIACVGNKGND